ncbi:MAG: DUF882 domain-containing protein [Fusobacteriaceae bacterium]|nr:DUF882 domain-containing protein [Fusobacteriaceae bacterium]
MKKQFQMLFGIILAIILIGCSGGSRRTASNEKISQYFTMQEAINSDYANKHHIDNYPKNSLHKKNIIETAKRMDKVRNLLGRPIRVSSWYRSPKVNNAIGGSDSSAHQDGLAVDFYLKKGQVKKEFNKIKNSSLSYDQLIFYPRGNRAHIGFRKGGKNERRQVMQSRKR